MEPTRLTRRAVVGGAIACAGSASLPTPAQAFLPALIEAIEVLVTLWNGFKMAQEVYETFFANRQQLVENEVGRVYGPRNFTVDNYYRFGNPYSVPHLGDAEPGCEASHRFQPNSNALCCAALDRTVFLPTGCVIALHSAVDDMRVSLREDNLFAYTRPIRYIRPVQPWQSFDESANRFYTDVQYYSASGSVALRWLITDRGARACVGEYKVRDDYSNRVIAEGQSDQFIY